MPIQNRFRGCLRTKSNDLHGVLFNCCDTEKKKNVPIKWTLPWKFSRVCLLCLPGSVRSKATTASMSNTPIIALCLYVMVEHSNTYEIHYEKLTSRRPACAPLLARPERISGLLCLLYCVFNVSQKYFWENPCFVFYLQLMHSRPMDSHIRISGVDTKRGTFSFSLDKMCLGLIS